MVAYNHIMCYNIGTIWEGIIMNRKKMNTKLMVGIIISIVGCIVAFSCIGCSTPWPTVLSIVLALIFGAPLIWRGVEENANSVVQSDGSKISITKSNEIKLKNSGFQFTKLCKFYVYSSEMYSALYIDDKNKKWAICFYNSNQYQIYHYSDLIAFELFENGYSKVQGRVGSVLIGDTFFGFAGAIAGASRAKKINEICSSLQIRITVNDIYCPELIIELISTTVNKDTTTYREMISLAKSLISHLNYISSNVLETK